MYQHTIIIEELRTLIGCRVRHGGILCEVVEILEHGPFVVLLNLEHGTIIQTNQHGDASAACPLRTRFRSCITPRAMCILRSPRSNWKIELRP